jgi:hypothetical protein
MSEQKLSPSRKAPSERERDAYEQGIEAGRKHLNDKPNPYRKDTVLADAYENGLLDGQKLK